MIQHIVHWIYLQVLLNPKNQPLHTNRVQHQTTKTSIDLNEIENATNDFLLCFSILASVWIRFACVWCACEVDGSDGCCGGDNGDEGWADVATTLTKLSFICRQMGRFVKHFRQMLIFTASCVDIIVMYVVAINSMMWRLFIYHYPATATAN